MKKRSIVILAWFMVLAIGSPSEARKRDMGVLAGHVYEIKTEGCKTGRDLCLDVVIDANEREIIVKRYSAKHWSPLLVGDFSGNGETPYTFGLDSVKKAKGGEVLVVGSEGDHGSWIEIKVKLFDYDEVEGRFLHASLSMKSEVGFTDSDTVSSSTSWKSLDAVKIK